MQNFSFNQQELEEEKDQSYQIPEYMKRPIEIPLERPLQRESKNYFTPLVLKNLPGMSSLALQDSQSFGNPNAEIDLYDQWKDDSKVMKSKRKT